MWPTLGKPRYIYHPIPHSGVHEPPLRLRCRCTVPCAYAVLTLSLLRLPTAPRLPEQMRQEPRVTHLWACTFYRASPKT